MGIFPQSNAIFVIKNGKIISGDCSNCYELRSDGLCVNNPETGEPDCYNYIASKSTTSIDNLLNKKDVNIDENYEQVDNYVTLREAQLTLIDGSKKKLNLLNQSIQLPSIIKLKKSIFAIVFLW